jgi:hypothetical protein
VTQREKSSDADARLAWEHHQELVAFIDTDGERNPSEWMLYLTSFSSVVASEEDAYNRRLARRVDGGGRVDRELECERKDVVRLKEELELEKVALSMEVRRAGEKRAA